MENFKQLLKDFGVITKYEVKEKDMSLEMFKELTSLMEQEGVNLKNYDVCSVSTDWTNDNTVVVQFKCVHYRVSSANDVNGYYQVTFK